MYTLSYYDAVKTDVQEAKSWYKHQQAGLDVRFAESIKVALQAIQSNPLAYAVRYKNVRVCHPKSFPYNIYFVVDLETKQIIIMAIVHSYRNLDFVSQRIE